MKNAVIKNHRSLGHGISTELECVTNDQFIKHIFRWKLLRKKSTQLFLFHPFSSRRAMQFLHRSANYDAIQSKPGANTMWVHLEPKKSFVDQQPSKWFFSSLKKVWQETLFLHSNAPNLALIRRKILILTKYYYCFRSAVPEIFSGIS